MLKSTLSLFLVSCLLGRLDCTDITLECSGSKDATEIMLRWERPDLSEGHVIYFKDGDFQKDLQHESFKGRVELRDPKWNKTGDFSVILKHVTMNDTGRYECHAGYDGQKPQLLSNITLKVEKPGQIEEQNKGGGNKGEENEEVEKKTGSAELIVGLVVGALVLVGAVSGFVYFYTKKHRNTSTEQNSYRPAAKKEEHVMSERSSELN